MKRNIFLGILIFLFLFPIFVYAKLPDDINYHSMTLNEALELDGIDKVKEPNKNNPITVHVFIGKGCPHCHDFLIYASTSLNKKLGDKVDYKIYETWYDEENEKLFGYVSNYFKLNRSGVPFIVIGNDYYKGYSSTYNHDIEAAIEKEYASEDRFDFFKALDEYEPPEDIDDPTEVPTKEVFKLPEWAVLILIILVPISFLVIVYVLFSKIDKKKKTNKKEKKKKNEKE